LFNNFSSNQRYEKSFTTLALLILFFYGLQAQNFVEEIEESKAKVSDKFKVKLQKLKKNDNFESIHFVNFNELARIQKNGRITLSLPKMKEPVELITFRMEYKTDTDYNWYATTKDGFGSVIIMRKGNEYNGHFSFRGKNEYQIYNDNGQHILVKMKPIEADYSKCSTKSDKKSNSIEPPKSSSGRIVDCFDPIRVLVLWTPNAAAADVNINNTVNTCIAQFNNSLYRSDAGQAVVVLAGSQEIAFGETNIDNDLSLLANNRPDVEAIRDNADADLVVLLTNGTYGGVRGSIGPFILQRAFGYAIVQVGAAISNAKTFSHELGHLFDARHDYDNDNSGLPYAHGYQISFGGGCTLMYAGANDRIENFSNLDVSISGKRTGTYSTENNTRRIVETAPTVRNYEPNPNENNLVASIFGLSHGYANQSYTCEAITQCAQPPFNYEWRTSTDGFNWSSNGVGEFFTNNLSWATNSYYYHIWLRVSTPNGQISDSYLSVYVNTNYNGEARMAATDENNSLSIAPISWKGQSREGTVEVDKLTIENVFPNPSLSNFTLNFFNPVTQHVSLDLVDILGKKNPIFADEKIGIGKHSKQINLSKYPIGTYILKFSSEKESVSSKIIVTQ
jgi:hypothetical protein